MTYFPQVNYSWWDRVSMRLLQTGPIPRHIAFIMDGNRRYAVERNLSLKNGHLKGFEKMTEMCCVCREFGVRVVSFYAFSIDNFNRSEKELGAMMEVFRKGLAKLVEELPLFDSYGICVRVLGKIDLFSIDIQKTISQFVSHTKKHKNFYINLCLGYSSREEIANAIHKMQSIEPNGIDFPILRNALYSQDLPEPDILIRTSGERRLSDFMLYQTGYSYIAFVESVWPEFSKSELMKVIFDYQKEFRMKSVTKIFK